MAFSFSGVSVAQGQTGFCHPVLGVSGLLLVRGRKRPLNGTILVLISVGSELDVGQDGCRSLYSCRSAVRGSILAARVAGR